jgi:hypothetical protein
VAWWCEHGNEPSDSWVSERLWASQEGFASQSCLNTTYSFVTIETFDFNYRTSCRLAPLGHLPLASVPIGLCVQACFIGKESKMRTNGFSSPSSNGEKIGVCRASLLAIVGANRVNFVTARPSFSTEWSWKVRNSDLHFPPIYLARKRWSLTVIISNKEDSFSNTGIDNCNGYFSFHHFVVIDFQYFAFTCYIKLGMALVQSWRTSWAVCCSAFLESSSVHCGCFGSDTYNTLFDFETAPQIIFYAFNIRKSMVWSQSLEQRPFQKLIFTQPCMKIFFRVTRRSQELACVRSCFQKFGVILQTSTFK